MKKILDACCGSRMFWFDRTNQDVVFADNRELETTLCDGRTLLVKPDIKMDFRESGDNTMKNKEQTNACYGCFGAANGDCDECAKDRSNKDEE